MPIRPDLRALYPDDWAEISHRVRFERAGGRCERCTRPHGRLVLCLPDGRWREVHDPRAWWTGDGVRAAPPAPADAARDRLTFVVLATAHLDHDPRNRDDTNLACFCQRCHLLHDYPHHRLQRWLTLRARLAIADLFLGPYALAPYPAGPYPLNR